MLPNHASYPYNTNNRNACPNKSDKKEGRITKYVILTNDANVYTGFDIRIIFTALGIKF